MIRFLLELLGIILIATVCFLAGTFLSIMAVGKVIMDVPIDYLINILIDYKNSGITDAKGTADFFKAKLNELQTIMEQEVK